MKSVMLIYHPIFHMLLRSLL